MFLPSPCVNDLKTEKIKYKCSVLNKMSTKAMSMERFIS